MAAVKEARGQRPTIALQELGLLILHAGVRLEKAASTSILCRDPTSSDLSKKMIKKVKKK